MSKNETIGSAAAAYADKIDYLVGPRHCAAREGFIAGAKWQADQELLNLARDPGSLDGARLVPRMPSVSGVSQTEIMAEILGLKKIVSDMQFGLGQQAGQNYSNLMAMLEAINKAVVEHGTAMHDRQNIVRHRFDDTTRLIRDVGQKVEAVLAVVTEEPEPETAIDWKSSSDQWKAAHHQMHKRAQKAEGELARLRALLKG